MITIKEVKSRKDRMLFVDFIGKLYEGNDCYVPSLRTDELDIMNPKKNASLKKCDCIWLIALKNGEVVGRIGGIYAPNSNKIWGEVKVRFTRFDFIDDLNVSKALLTAVEKWGKEKGMSSIHGPMGFTDFDEEGMLIEGFDQISTFITIYNYSYYPNHMEANGYVKDADWIEQLIMMPDKIDPRLTKISELLQKRYLYELYEPKSRAQSMKIAKEALALHSESYAKLYGFVPLSDEEKKGITSQYIGLLNPDFIKLVRAKDGTIIAFGIGMPSLAKAAQKGKGRLFPGIFYLLRALKKNDVLELLIIGVAPKYQKQGVHAILMTAMIKTCVEYGIKYAESNPELENNLNIQNIFKRYETRQHKRRRAYTKKL